MLGLPVVFVPLHYPIFKANLIFLSFVNIWGLMVSKSIILEYFGKFWLWGQVWVDRQDLLIVFLPKGSPNYLASQHNKKPQWPCRILNLRVKSPPRILPPPGYGPTIVFSPNPICDQVLNHRPHPLLFSSPSPSL